MKKLSNKELAQQQTMNINKSLKIFKNSGASYRSRDLEQIEGTDYLQDLSKEDLAWYIDNSQDFLYNTSTQDSKIRDVYAQNPIHEEFILDTYEAVEEDRIIKLLKVLNDKRNVKKYLLEELEDEITAFPEEEELLRATYTSTLAFLSKLR